MPPLMELVDDSAFYVSTNMALLVELTSMEHAAKLPGTFKVPGNFNKVSQGGAALTLGYCMLPFQGRTATILKFGMASDNHIRLPRRG